MFIINTQKCFNIRNIRDMLEIQKCFNTGKIFFLRGMVDRKSCSFKALLKPGERWLPELTQGNTKKSPVEHLNQKNAINREKKMSTSHELQIVEDLCTKKFRVSDAGDKWSLRDGQGQQSMEWRANWEEIGIHSPQGQRCKY